MANPIRRILPLIIDAVASFADGIKRDIIGPASISDPGHDHGGVTGANGALVLAGHVRLTNPIAADLVTIVNAVDMANGVQVIAAQPDVPRKLQVRKVDANSSVSAGSLVLVGIGARGQAVTQTIPLTGGTATVTTTDAYASLTSATISGLVGAASGDTIGIGPATALGLPVAQGATGVAVYRALVDDAGEAVGTVDATAGTIVPTTVPNGTHDYDFWFTGNIATHTHTVASDTTDASIVAGTGSIHYDRGEYTVATANASSLSTSVALTKALIVAYNLHIADLLAHGAADATNTVASTYADVINLATAITAANQLKAAYNAHRSQSGVHPNDDSGHETTASDATDQSSLNTLLNELKGDFNAHIASGLSAPSLRVTDA